MQSFARLVLTPAVVLVSIGLWAQEVYHWHDPDVFARLSYDSWATGGVDGARRICLTVSPGGDYRIVRSLENGQTQRLHGKIPPEQFRTLRSLLSAEFWALAGDHVGLIRKDAEIFTAELPVPGLQRGEDRTRRLRWLNADGENAFPSPLTKVVDWLKHFDPKNGELFDYAEQPDVCPSAQLRLLQPPVAENSQP